MEVVDDSSVLTSTVDTMKSNIPKDEPITNLTEIDACQKSNGFAEKEKAAQSSLVVDITKESVTDSTCIAVESQIIIESKNAANTSKIEETVIPSSSEHQEVVVSAHVDVADAEVQPESDAADTNVTNTGIKRKAETELERDQCVIDINNSEVIHNDNVIFETEILVVTNDNDTEVNEIRVEEPLQECTTNILGELGQSIELSEALRSSGSIENGENNNHTTGQEVFNKEELLDILEGNDVQPSGNDMEYEVEVEVSSLKSLEAQLALQQLSRLKKSRSKGNKSTKMTPQRKHVKLPKRKSVLKDIEKEDSIVKILPKTESVSKDIQKEDSIVNLLVKDWQDDIPTEEEQIENLKEECDTEVHSSEISLKTQDDSVDSSMGEGLLNKSNDDGQPQRSSRVIKKKVIFDPDNPDTFTKSKLVKNKELPEKEEPPTKKGKTEQTTQRPKSKSPVSKLQWKKPPPKNNSKQNRRLTEVDKLLMDEGAVNMIYQLTPEAPKGKKNMKTKAEFIKKIQSSTPESKEMKFRERKKETGKCEEGEAKKILGGKLRTSLSSSVKSPSVCEDFETHSADDSIIYRRHSSSSYSSACMSPRRLSDVEGANQIAQVKALENQNQNEKEGESGDTFILDTKKIPTSEIINKDDCLSIKEKLNSKLSLALKKRKRESSKIEKPMKQKKISKTDEKCKLKEINTFKCLSVTFDQRVAEICIRKSGSKCSIEVLKELESALTYVDSRKEVSVTLLTSECGTLFSLLNLVPLLDDNIEKRTSSAHELAESIRLLLTSVAQHSKLVCAGVWGACTGVALALLAMSDVVIASERASFSLANSEQVAAPVMPGVAALSAQCLSLSQSLVKDLVVFGRQLSASDALQGGLVSRVLWPDRFLSQLRSIVKDVAAQPPPNLLLKKRLMNLTSGSDITFLTSLEKERDLIVEYWSSVEGQQLLRRAVETV
ncbi:uncharacterized protein ACR2FA_012649 [Aphomia sociella]